MKSLLVVAVLASGCSCKDKPTADKSPLPASGSGLGKSTCKADPPPEHACNYANCGGNSALINAFPVDGFRTNGDCNEDQVQVVPGSMEGGLNEKCKGMTLDIDGDKLIGRGATGKCEALELEKATFQIRTTKGEARITIAEVTEYPAAGKTFPAYRMEWKDHAGNKTALCAKEGQRLRHKLGVSSMRWSDDVPTPDKQLVIPIVSELYDDTGRAIKDRDWWDDHSKVEWLHLACVDDALAKRTINGHHKPNDATAHAANRAALRMWTADYCGGRPFTMRGRQFAWSPNPTLPIEAQWTENGASCLTKPRIIFNNGKEEAPTKTTKLLDAFCAASHKDCKLVQTWIDEAKTCTKSPPETGNSTSQTDHVLPDCKECSGSNCPLESRNVK